ncbi:MAG: dienelactone hydrolase family protein, partial [Bacteroidota bacterium]
AQDKQSCCMSSSQEFAALLADAKFVNAHLEPLPFRYSPEHGAWVTFKTTDSADGRAFEVKSAKPTDNYILLVHEWWGLNDYIQREAENLQKELGAVNVLALDLYEGKIATTREEAGKDMGEVKEERARSIIAGAIKYVGAKAKIGTIGWCFGGGWSLQTSLMAGSQAVACVMYYGMPEKDVATLKKLNAPVLGIFGTKDQWISPAVVAEFKKNMKQAGKSLTVKSYDADHAFANPSNPQFDKPATQDAHKRALAFFKKNLLK